ncbi:hypothetical protein ACFHW2_20955 [Actinomadura sp. LOL_016]
MRTTTTSGWSAARVDLSADVLARIDDALSGVATSGGTLLR